MESVDIRGYMKKVGKNYSCLLCTDFTRTEIKILQHIKQLHVGHAEHHNGRIILMCKKLCHKDAHYHCYHCNDIFSKKCRFRKHLSRITRETVNGNIENVSSNITTATNIAAQNDTAVEANVTADINTVPVTDVAAKHSTIRSGSNTSAEKVVSCDECGKSMYKKNLRTHISNIHRKENKGISHQRFHQGSCIDEDNGIFLISEQLSGIQHPVHIQKYLVGNKPAIMFCESKTCEYMKVVSNISGKSSFECPHLLSAQYLTFTKPVVLDLSALNHLVATRRISETTKNHCIRQRYEAQSWGKVLVNSMRNCGTVSDRYIFLSVWTGEIHYYSRVGRVVLTFDKESFDLLCRCTNSSNIGCTHKPIAKWYLCCLHPQLFHTDAPVESNQFCKQRIKDFSLDSKLSMMIDYQLQNKVLPFAVSESELTETFPSDIVLIPSEKSCVFCNEVLVMKDCCTKAKLVTRFGVVQIVKVWKKVCNNCLVEYSYSEGGIFNLDNKLFVSFDLLIWMRNALQEHVALSKEISFIEKRYKVTLNKDRIRKCFFKFIALTEEKDMFKCCICGYFPVILNFDVNRKCSFKLDDIEGDSCFDEMVDCRKFWNTLSKIALAESFHEVGTSKLIPSLGFWAPYIGEESRKDDMVYSTEFLKGAQEDEEQQFLECLPEESLEDLFDMADLQKLRSLCEHCGVNASKLTKVGCISKLKSAVASKVKIDKFFFKIWHSSGGLLCATCPHGIVYSFKCLLKAESPRDIGDILLSLKHPPNVVISDVPHMVAAHVNKREENFFNPHSGRVAAPTDDNILLAEQNNFGVLSFPWLDRRFQKATTDLNLRGTSIHPITLVQQRMSLYDKFHENNTKQKKEILRRTKYVKEMEGVVTETAEQLNAFISRNLYFLDCLSPIHHLLMLKCLFSVRNFEINKAILNKVGECHYDEYGRAMKTDVPAFHMQQGQVCQPHGQPDQAEKQQQQPQEVQQMEELPGDQHDQQDDEQSEQLLQPQPVEIEQDENEVSQHLEQGSYNHVTEKRKYSVCDRIFLTAAKTLFKGLPNNFNNCWFNAVVFAIRSTYGSTKLYEDVISNTSTLDFFVSSFGPVLGALNVCSDKNIFEGKKLETILRSYFKDNSSFQIGTEQDPIKFFLMAAGHIDSNSELLLQSIPVFEVELETNIVCLGCGVSSSRVSKETCLSLAMDKSLERTDILDLIKKYFEDEVLEEFLCKECMKRKSALARKIKNMPPVLAIHLKRYDESLIKSMDLVIPNKNLDLSMHMENRNSSYQLRAIVAHKGRTIDTGHYTCTVIEKQLSERGIILELDGVRNLYHKDDEYINRGGYIFLYENKVLIEGLIEDWYLLSPILVRLNKCLLQLRRESILNKSLDVLWDSFKVEKESLSLCSDLLNLLCGQLARHFSLDLVKDNKILCTTDVVEYLSSLLGVTVGCSLDALITLSCPECGHSEKKFESYKNLDCDELSGASLLNTVEELVTSYEWFCSECGSSVEAEDTSILPIFLSPFLVILVSGQLRETSIDTRAIFKHHPHYAADSYSLIALVNEDKVTILKDEHCFEIKEGKVDFQNLVSISYPNFAILTANFHERVDFAETSIEHKHFSIEVKDHAGTLDEIRFNLDACLGNYLHSSNHKYIQEIQNVIFKGDLSSKLCGYLLDVWLQCSICYVYFKSYMCFRNKSIVDKMCSIGLLNTHSYVLLDFTNGLILFDIEQVEIFSIGNDNLKKKEDVIMMINFLDTIVLKRDGFCHSGDFKIKRISDKHKEADSCKRINLIEVVFLLMSSKELIIMQGEQLWLRTAIKVLNMSLIREEGEIIQHLTEKCAFVSALKHNTSPTVVKYFVANEGKLFNKEVKVERLVNKIRKHYANYEMGAVQEEMCYEVLNFIMTQMEDISSYYFLNGNVDKDDVCRIRSMLLSRDFRKLHNRFSFIIETEGMMNKCLPVMLFKCIQSTVKVLLTDEATNFPVTNKNILNYQTFNEIDYIALVIVNRVVRMFLLEKTGVTEEELRKYIGVIGQC